MMRREMRYSEIAIGGAGGNELYQCLRPSEPALSPEHRIQILFFIFVLLLCVDRISDSDKQERSRCANTFGSIHKCTSIVLKRPSYRPWRGGHSVRLANPG